MRLHLPTVNSRSNTDILKNRWNWKQRAVASTNLVAGRWHHGVVYNPGDMVKMGEAVDTAADLAFWLEMIVVLSLALRENSTRPKSHDSYCMMIYTQRVRNL